LFASDTEVVADAMLQAYLPNVDAFQRCDNESTSGGGGGSGASFGARILPSKDVSLLIGARVPASQILPDPKSIFERARALGVGPDPERVTETRRQLMAIAPQLTVQQREQVEQVLRSVEIDGTKDDPYACTTCAASVGTAIGSGLVMFFSV